MRGERQAGFVFGGSTGNSGGTLAFIFDEAAQRDFYSSQEISPEIFLEIHAIRSSYGEGVGFDEENDEDDEF